MHRTNIFFFEISKKIKFVKKKMPGMLTIKLFFFHLFQSFNTFMKHGVSFTETSNPNICLAKFYPQMESDYAQQILACFVEPSSTKQKSTSVSCSSGKSCRRHDQSFAEDNQVAGPSTRNLTKDMSPKEIIRRTGSRKVNRYNFINFQ